MLENEVNALITWTSGNIFMTSSTNPARQAEILNYGLFDAQANATLTNDTQFPGLDFINEPGAFFTKNAGGLATIGVLFVTFGGFDLRGWGASFPGGFIQNDGTAYVSNGFLDAAFYALNKGTLVIGNTGAGQVKVSTGLTIAQGCTLAGIGTVVGSVTNNGTLNLGQGQFGAPVGILTITGDYTQSATGSLILRLLQAQNLQYDRVAINGTANLGGTLTVNALAGFNPAAGDIFTIVTYAQEVGDFNQYNLPVLNQPRSWAPTQPSTTFLKLVVQ